MGVPLSESESRRFVRRRRVGLGLVLAAMLPVLVIGLLLGAIIVGDLDGSRGRPIILWLAAGSAVAMLPGVYICEDANKKLRNREVSTLPNPSQRRALRKFGTFLLIVGILGVAFNLIVTIGNATGNDVVPWPLVAVSAASDVLFVVVGYILRRSSGRTLDQPAEALG